MKGLRVQGLGSDEAYYKGSFKPAIGVSTMGLDSSGRDFLS